MSCAPQQDIPDFSFHQPVSRSTIQNLTFNLLFININIFSYVLYKTYCCLAECHLYCFATGADSSLEDALAKIDPFGRTLIPANRGCPPYQTDKEA
jgi:hypothetical protein